MAPHWERLASLLEENAAVRLHDATQEELEAELHQQIHLEKASECCKGPPKKECGFRVLPTNFSHA